MSNKEDVIGYIPTSGESDPNLAAGLEGLAEAVRRAIRVTGKQPAKKSSSREVGKEPALEK